jgi:hypothetical protein
MPVARWMRLPLGRPVSAAILEPRQPLPVSMRRSWPCARAGAGSELSTRPTASLNRHHVGSFDSTIKLALSCPAPGWRAVGRYAGTFSPRPLAVTRASLRAKPRGGIGATEHLATQTPTQNANARHATAGRHSHARYWTARLHSHAGYATDQRHSHRRHAGQRHTTDRRHSHGRHATRSLWERYSLAHL